MTNLASGRALVWIVVAVYLVLITAAGSYRSKFMVSSGAYFKGGNAIPWWAAGVSMYMSNFTAYTFVGIGSPVYSEGTTGLLLETGPALAFLVSARLFAQRRHRLNPMSPPSFRRRASIRSRAKHFPRSASPRRTSRAA